jgi:hypothetical protein
MYTLQHTLRRCASVRPYNLPPQNARPARFLGRTESETKPKRVFAVPLCLCVSSMRNEHNVIVARVVACCTEMGWCAHTNTSHNAALQGTLGSNGAREQSDWGEMGG